MAYIALYRKWRPTKFDDIVGQNSISTVLKNQIKSGRIAHAYLFSGGRGTGKTTTAKILSRAVNCLNPIDGNPCNECEICKGILNGEIMDVVEMDAASNNGVDEVRQIRDEVAYTPTKARYRVYIVDEVHMFSNSAFNALLKTLEEPPEHIIFILATTEQHKIPATILSRCQRYEFKQISKKDIVSRLKVIIDDLGIKYKEDALELIATLADGAMRDAISILDQCTGISDEITMENVISVVGIVEQNEIYKLTEAILNKNFTDCINIVDNYAKSGKDLEQLVDLLTKVFRDLLVYKTTKTQDDIYSGIVNFELLKDLEPNAKQDVLVNAIYSLSDLSNRLRWATQPRIMIEVELVKLCSEPVKIEAMTVAPPKSDVKREKNIEKKIQEDKVEQKEEPKPSKNEKTEEVQETRETFEQWQDIVKEIKSEDIGLYANLVNATGFKVDEKTIGIQFKPVAETFGKSLLQNATKKKTIEKAIEKVTGIKFGIKLIEAVKQKAKKDEDKVIDVAKKLNIPINIIEE